MYFYILIVCWGQYFGSDEYLFASSMLQVLFMHWLVSFSVILIQPNILLLNIIFTTGTCCELNKTALFYQWINYDWSQWKNTNWVLQPMISLF